MNKTRNSPLRSHLQRFLLATTAALACSVPRASAVDTTWTNLSFSSVWDSLAFPANWSTFMVPTAGDTAIFPANFTPSVLDSFIGIRTDGSEIELANVAPGFLLPPTAGNLIFLNSWKLTQDPRGFVPLFMFPSSGLTLTGGEITVVGADHTAIIDANILVTSGLLTKLGDGTLLLERNVQGSILVQQGTLGGNFYVNGSLTNEATLSPGNSPGLIRIASNFTQTHSGHLEIQVASPGSYDQLQIGGKAHLDGTLDVSLLDGYRPRKGQKFYILNAGKVSGQFEEVNAPVWNDLTLRPFYQSNRVYLKTVIDSFEALGGLSRDQQAVAHTLDTAIGDPRANNLLNFLYNRSFNDLPRDFDRLAPEELTSMFTIGVSLAQVQSLNIQRRTDDIRSGANGFSAANLAINGDGPSYSGGFGITTGVAGPNGHDGKEVKETKSVLPEENRWGVFLSGTGEWVSVGDTNNARGYDLTSGGFTLGVDYKVCQNFAIGLAAGYTGTTADLTDRGRVWVNGGKIGLYATCFQNEQVAAAPTMSKDSSKESKAVQPLATSVAKGLYADFAAFGGYNSYDTRRGALKGEARGDTDGGELNVLFGMGYDIKHGGWTFGPTASFNYTYIGTNSFTEHNSLAPLDVHGGKGESLRTAFGFKVNYECKCGNVVIKPELRAAWQHEYGDAVYDLTSNFSSGAGDSFTVGGPKIGRDSALIGAGFAIQLSERCATYFYYDGELGRRNYESNAVTGGFRIAF